MAEAHQEVQGLQADMAAAADMLQRAQMEHQRSCQVLAGMSGALFGQAGSLAGALDALLQLVPHAGEISDAGAALLDLRKSTQASAFQCVLWSNQKDIVLDAKPVIKFIEAVLLVPSSLYSLQLDKSGAFGKQM